MDLDDKFEVSLDKFVAKSDPTAGSLRSYSLELAFGQDHDSPVRPVLLLKLADHLKHGFICKAFAQDRFHDPLLTFLRHPCLSVLLSQKLEQ